MPSKLSKGLTLLKAKIDEYNAKHRSKVLNQWMIAPEHHPEFIAEGKLQDRRARELPGPDKKPNLPGGKVSGTYPDEADVVKAKVDQIRHGRSGKTGRDEYTSAASGKVRDRSGRAFDALIPHYDVLDNSPGHEGMLTEHSEDRLFTLQNQNKYMKPKLPGGHSRAHPDYIGTNVEKTGDVKRENKRKKNAYTLGRYRHEYFYATPDALAIRRVREGFVDLEPDPRVLPGGKVSGTYPEEADDVKKAKIDDVRHGKTGRSNIIANDAKRRDRENRHYRDQDIYTEPTSRFGAPGDPERHGFHPDQSRRGAYVEPLGPNQGGVSRIRKPKLPGGKVSGTYPEEADDVKKTGPTKRKNKRAKQDWVANRTEGPITDVAAGRAAERSDIIERALNRRDADPMDPRASKWHGRGKGRFGGGVTNLPGGNVSGTYPEEADVKKAHWHKFGPPGEIKWHHDEQWDEYPNHDGSSTRVERHIGETHGGKDSRTDYQIFHERRFSRNQEEVRVPGSSPVAIEISHGNAPRNRFARTHSSVESAKDTAMRHHISNHFGFDDEDHEAIEHAWGENGIHRFTHMHPDHVQHEMNRAHEHLKASKGDVVKKVKIDDVRHGKTGRRFNDQNSGAAAAKRVARGFRPTQYGSHDVYDERGPEGLTAGPTREHQIFRQQMRLDITRNALPKPNLPGGKISGTYPEEADEVKKINYRSKGKAEGKVSKPGTKYDSKARDVLSDIKSNVSTGQVRPGGERSRRSSGAPLKPEGSMYAIGENRPGHSAGVKDRTILSYGGHWPVVTHYHDKKLLVLNAHPYSGPTKLVTKTLLHEVPKKFPGHKIIQVAAHSHHEISRVMKGNLHDLHEHLGRMADHHEDKVLSLAAKHEPEHSNEDVKKLVQHHVGEVKRYRADRDHLGKILYGKSK